MNGRFSGDDRENDCDEKKSHCANNSLQAELLCTCCHADSYNVQADFCILSLLVFGWDCR